jgi:hypothetical protein
VRVEGRPVHHGIAGAAMPARMSAPGVSEADDVTDQDLIRTQRVSVRAARWRAGDPRPGSGPY